jgi:hypothetical protein
VLRCGTLGFVYSIGAIRWFIECGTVENRYLQGR